MILLAHGCFISTLPVSLPFGLEYAMDTMCDYYFTFPGSLKSFIEEIPPLDFITHRYSLSFLFAANLLLGGTAKFALQQNLDSVVVLVILSSHVYLTNTLL